MTDAQHTVEVRRDELTTRVCVLEEQIPELCYQIAVGGSFIARQKLRALEWELERLADEIAILNTALCYIAKLSGQRDAREVLRELFGSKHL